MCGLVDVWLGGWVSDWVDVWVSGCVSEWLDVWLGECVGDGWMVVRMDGWGDV